LTDVEESFASNDMHEILEQLTDFFPFVNCTYDELMKAKNDIDLSDVNIEEVN